MMRDHNIRYDFAGRTRALNAAGLGAVQLLVQRLGLAGAINARLRLLKRHVPYFESDHILNLAYNLVLGGKALDDLELLRNNEIYLDALGAQRTPDPTTEGDFLRRFKPAHLDVLMDLINDKRLLVWQQQPDSFFEQAIIEADGTIVETQGECKQGIDLSYDGRWGYHPLLVSLANTQEVLYLYNRSGNRPSYEGAADYFDRAAVLCRRGGFRQILFRGDTDFSQTTHLDRWHGQGIGFVFGLDAQPNVVALAQALPEGAWQALDRPPRYTVKTQSRERPENVREGVVQRRGYRNLRLVGEQVAALDYQPVACTRAYRLVVVRKQLVVERRGQVIGTETRYLFYLTNQKDWTCARVVFFANDRCNEENLVAQLQNGVKALHAPVNTLVGNWAYMVIGALVWSLKAWIGLLQPEPAIRQRILAMEYRTFLDEVMQLPCQVVRTGRQLVYRLLQWNPWATLLCRIVERLERLRWT
jgi:hypothetical protein